MEDRVGYAIKRVQQALRAAMHDELGELGLTAAQYSALARLEDEPGLSQAELARRCFVTPQSMSGIRAGLQRNGLVRRAEHASRGRALDTALTRRGRTLVRRAHERIGAVEARMTSGLDEGEQLHLLTALRDCANRLEGHRAAR